VEGRIKRNIYILIGVTFVLLVGMIIAWFVRLIKPLKERTATVQQQYTERKAVADTLPTKLAAQKQAEDRTVYLQGQLAYFRSRYRNLQFGDIGTDMATATPLQKAARIQAWRAMLNEFYAGYSNSLRTTLINVANQTGVTINIASPRVDAPPRAPEDLVIPANGFFRPTSNSNNGVLSASITGSLPNIMRFFNRINISPILMVIGTIKLDSANAGGGAGGAGGTPGATNVNLATTGEPNQITATFTVTPYLLAAGSGVTLSAGGATATGAPGAPGAPTDARIDARTGAP
jgi:Na+-transporting methylmalonyl-CoA/oxaloacetate decarboxylase gamma subunit